jgi:hypothetical protein
MSMPKHWLLGGWYPRGLIVHQQRYPPSDSNTNVDIKFSAHDTFLEGPSSGTIKIERLENQII